MTPLYNCTDGSSGNLIITAENDANTITVTITRTGQLNENKPNEFTRVTWIAKQGDNVVSGNTEGFENSPKTSYSFTIQKPDGSNLLSCARYSISITIHGLEGYDALRTCLDPSNQAPGAPNTQGRFDGIFTYIVKTPCVTTPPTCEGIRTQTQGYYGSSPTGIKYLAANYSSKIGTAGITIGCGTNTKTYTSASALTTAIKSGTATPVVLPKLSTFSSQVLTLAVNLKLWPNTANLIVTTGTFAGLTVQQVLDLANQVLGACNTTYTPSQLNNIVDAINNSYDNGNDNGSGILSCP